MPIVVISVAGRPRETTAARGRVIVRPSPRSNDGSTSGVVAQAEHVPRHRLELGRVARGLRRLGRPLSVTMACLTLLVQAVLRGSTFLDLGFLQSSERRWKTESSVLSGIFGRSPARGQAR